MGDAYNMKSVMIKGTGVYVPANKVYNDQMDEHFEKRGLSAHSLMEHLGRRKRYFISEGENTISMCQNAIDDCVKKHRIDLREIEMLVVCTDTPEYLFPTNALKLVGLYGENLKNANVAFDLNSNCTGMVQGMDIVAKYMKNSNISHALVVGCLCISPIAQWGDTVVYANFADAAACVALECIEEDKTKGFIDSQVYVNACVHQNVTYPKCGMSKVPLKKIEPNEKRLEWIPFSMDNIPSELAALIRSVLERNNLTTNDIDYYIFSQLSDSYNMDTLKALNESEKKYYFVGGEYGYTGNTCPILCLNRMWDIYAKPGNKIIISTVGAGYSMIAQLYEF